MGPVYLNRYNHKAIAWHVNCFPEACCPAKVRQLLRTHGDRKKKQQHWARCHRCRQFVSLPCLVQVITCVFVSAVSFQHSPLPFHISHLRHRWRSAWDVYKTFHGHSYVSCMAMKRGFIKSNAIWRFLVIDLPHCLGPRALIIGE
jgi:hypothetical protein